MGCPQILILAFGFDLGVATTEIDSQQNKVTVTGDVDADTLIKKLAKSGKHAELWPMEKKPNNPNPNPNPNGKEMGKEVAKEKDASKSKEPNLKPERAPEKLAATATSSETDTKPAETTTKEPAPLAAAKQVESAAKPAESSSKPDPRPDKAPVTSSETDAKPADTATKTDSSGKKKSKNKGGVEAAGNEEVFVMNSGGAPPMQPAYQQPVYAASYNMAHPTASYSYHALLPPHPQSYIYSGHLPPPQGYMYPNHPPPPEYYPRYPPENYYPHESYYESAPSSSHSQGSYDYFSDENANACNVM